MEREFSPFLAQLSYSDADSREGCRTIVQHSDPPIFLSSYSCNVRGNVHPAPLLDTPKTVREMPVRSKSILCTPRHGLTKRYHSPIHRAQNLAMKRRFCVAAGVHGVFLVENARKFWDPAEDALWVERAAELRRWEGGLGRTGDRSCTPYSRPGGGLGGVRVGRKAGGRKREGEWRGEGSGDGGA